VRRRKIAKGPIKDEKPKLLLASFLEGDVTSLDQCDFEILLSMAGQGVIKVCLRS
jgi:hypothetical protein